MKRGRKLIAQVSIASAFVGASVLPAAQITVQGGCTLADAVRSANADSSIGGCSAGSGADTIVLTADVELDSVADVSDGFTALPAVTTSIVIRGENHEIARDQTSAIAFRLFLVKPTGELVLDRVAVTGGLERLGGALKNDAGDLTIKNSTVTANQATGSGGAIYNAGVIGDSAVLQVYRTVFSQNRVANDSTLDVQGGALFNSFDAEATIEESTFESNAAGNLLHTTADGGAIWNQSGATLTITGSTFVGNASLGASGSLGRGSAIRNRASAISGGSFTVVNSTFSGNVGVGVDAAAIYNSADAALRQLTFWGNSPNAIKNATSGGDVTTLEASLLAGTLGGDNCTGSAFTALGINQADDVSCGFASLVVGLDPVLADNGGPTPTHALLAGSSAIDTVPPATCTVAGDQRGAPRIANCDLGAVEYLGCPDLKISADTITTSETYEECAVTLGPDLLVSGANGQLTVRFGTQTRFLGGVSFGSGSELVVEHDPSLQLLVSELIEADRSRRQERAGLER